MNYTRLLLLLFSIFVLGRAAAQVDRQEVTIKGRVLSAQSKTPLEYAGVSIFAGDKVLKGTLINEKGEFLLRTNPGTYTLRVEYLSFKPFVLQNIIALRDTLLADIYLEEDAKILNTVTVTGSKPDVEYQLDKKVFNVGKDLLSRGGSANDVLNNVPSVNVDANGAVSLRGNSSVRILINGKPSVLSMNNGLEQLQASTIDKIEVITNPSAQYEAQGGAGIINIVLKKNTAQGFNGSVQAGVGNPVNYRANTNLSYKTNQFNLFSNAAYGYSNTYRSEERYQQGLLTNLPLILQQKNKQGSNDRVYTIYAGGDYYINDKNTLTGSFYHDKAVNTDTINYKYHYSDLNGNRDSMLSRFENYREPQNFNELGLNYVKTFDKAGVKWTTSLLYDFWNDDENEHISHQKTWPATSPASRLLTRDIESSKDIYIQSDFVNPLSDHTKLEFGIRTDLRAIRSEYMATQDGVLLSRFDNKLKYNENLYSAYIQFGSKKNRFGYLLGLRSELSSIGISDRKASIDRYKNYINLFPTMHLTYQVLKNSDLQLSYSRRITRPEFPLLNPFGGLSDTRYVTAGNPDLDPMYTSSYELGFLAKPGKFSINPSVYYQHSSNYFEYILKRDKDGFFTRSPVNLDNEQRYGAELSTQYNPYKWLRLMWEINYYGFSREGEFEGRNYDVKDQTWTTRLGSKLKFAKALSFDFNLDYRGNNRGVQTLNRAVLRANAGMGRDFLNDKLSFALSAANLFNSQVIEQITQTDTYRLESTFRAPGRQINATITYRFNRSRDQEDRLPASN